MTLSRYLSDFQANSATIKVFIQLKSTYGWISEKRESRQREPLLQRIISNFLHWPSRRNMTENVLAMSAAVQVNIDKAAKTVLSYGYVPVMAVTRFTIVVEQKYLTIQIADSTDFSKVRVKRRSKSKVRLNCRRVIVIGGIWVQQGPKEIA